MLHWQTNRQRVQELLSEEFEGCEEEIATALGSLEKMVVRRMVTP